MIPRSFLTLCLCLGLGAIPGCSALTAVSGAAESLDIYTLTPARPAPVRSNGRHVVVTPATASGALMTDRILVKPNRLQAEYLPGGRWSDAAPVLVQSLVVASLQNSGAFRLVGRDDAGLMPDFTLLADLRELLRQFEMHDGNVDIALKELGDAIQAALTLDSLDLLEEDLEWIAGLLVPETAVYIFEVHCFLGRVRPSRDGELTGIFFNEW